MIQPIAIEKYCDALKDRILFEQFNHSTHITGESIKKLTPSPQINSFVIRRIFEKWSKEAEKLKSPYFDYDDDNVKQAMKDFMSKLSFHIKINKDYFEVILKEALHDAFEYLENPIYFLQSEIFEFKGSMISGKEIKTRAKFMKLYASEMENFLNNIQINKEEVSIPVLMKVIEDIFEDCNKLEEEKQFVESISKIVPNNFINLLETKPAIEKVGNKKNFIDDLEFEDIDLDLDLPEQEESLTDHVIEKIKEEEIVVEKTEEKEIVEVQTPDALASNNTQNLSKPKVEVDSATFLVPIQSFKDGISLQQKFYFIKSLFNMDDESYQLALIEADRKVDFDQACNHLWERFANKFDWANKEEPLAEFFAILNRKFL